MSEVITMKIEEETVTYMENMCCDLFREWSVDLNLEEKKILLWNASVEMRKIKQRRSLVC